MTTVEFPIKGGNQRWLGSNELGLLPLKTILFRLLFLTGGVSALTSTDTSPWKLRRLCG
jgi:hypothetical protein